MFQVIGKFPKFKVNQRFEKQADTRNKKILAAGIRAWLEAVTGRIPVWTGQAQAGVREVNNLLPLLDSQKVTLPPLVATSSSSRYNSSIRQQAGRDKSLATLTIKNGYYGFSFDTKIEYFYYNENNPNLRLREPTPWRALAAGRQAFVKATQAEAAKLKPPNILENRNG